MNTDLEDRLRESLARHHASVQTSLSAPPRLLRRARRRAVLTVLAATTSVLVVGVAAVGGTRLLLEREPNPAIGETDSDGVLLPTQGPVPGESSLELDHGSVDGQGWTLRVTGGGPSGLGLSFEWDGQGGGGGGIGPMGGSRVFQGYGGSSSASYPNGDTTRPPLPRELAGQVRADAARVELRLEGGPAIEARVYALPVELIGRAKVFLLFIPADTLLVAGELVAYDGSGAPIGSVYYDGTPVSLFPKVLEEASPAELEVMKRLQLAGAVVGRYYDTHGSFSGLSPETASAISDDVVFNSSDVAIADEVSLRVSGPQNLVLASATPDGEVYSACLISGAGGAVYGRNDTSDPYACSNGWLDEAGPPLETGNVPIATGSDGHGNLWSLALVDVGKDFELEYLIATIGTYKPLEPLGRADLGSIAAIPPSDTPQGVPPVPGIPTSVYGLASDRVARIELQTEDGGTFEGTLYPIPGGSIDAAQAFLVLAPLDGVTGTVIAYDAAGNELQRERASTTG